MVVRSITKPKKKCKYIDMVQSNVEAEYPVLASTTNKLIWIKQIFADIGIKIQAPIKIFYDNQTARHCFKPDVSQTNKAY
jgi:hypothetical protein